MNSFLLRSGNDSDKDNYMIIIFLTLFLVFKIFYVGIYPSFYGNGDLYLIFKPLIFYIIYYFILFLFNKRSVSYDMLSSLVMAFIIPNYVSLFIFVLGSIIGNIICYMFDNRINNNIFSSLLIMIYLNINGNLIDFSYSGIFGYVYLLMCLFSCFYLVFNKLIKIRLVVSLVICLFVFFYIYNMVLDNLLFIILFLVLDNRYSPITKLFQFIGGIVFGVLFYVFNYIFFVNYASILSVFCFEVFTVVINYLCVKFYNNRGFKYLFGV